MPMVERPERAGRERLQGLRQSEMLNDPLCLLQEKMAFFGSIVKAFVRSVHKLGDDLRLRCAVRANASGQRKREIKSDRTRDDLRWSTMTLYSIIFFS
jgi:hypothetical protein